MAAKLAISSPLTTTIALPNKFSSQALSYIPASPRTKTKHLRIHAQLGLPSFIYFIYNFLCLCVCVCVYVCVEKHYIYFTCIFLLLNQIKKWSRWICLFIGGEGGGEVKQKEKRKFITKDQEPEQ